MVPFQGLSGGSSLRCLAPGLGELEQMGLAGYVSSSTGLLREASLSSFDEVADFPQSEILETTRWKLKASHDLVLEVSEITSLHSVGQACPRGPFRFKERMRLILNGRSSKEFEAISRYSLLF